MKKLLSITALTLTAIIGGVVWYVQNTSQNHRGDVIANEAKQSQDNNVVPASTTKQSPNNNNVIASATKQSPSKNPKTVAPFHTDTPSSDNAQNQDTAIHYNPDGSIDTSNWQEYCNQEYGFCVKYPAYFIRMWFDNDENLGTGLKLRGHLDGTLCSETDLDAGRCGVEVMISPSSVWVFDLSKRDDSVYFKLNGNEFVTAGGEDLVKPYLNTLLFGDGAICGREYHSAFGFQLVNPPKNWNVPIINNIYFTCGNKEYAPVIRGIFRTLRFTDR